VTNAADSGVAEAIRRVVEGGEGPEITRRQRRQHPQRRGVILMSMPMTVIKRSLRRPLEGASLRVGDSVRSDNPKKYVTLRLDSDVVEHYRASGPGWQTRINDDLRQAAHLPRRDKRV
jgi:uncharacterized protein (DUF4415 family)